VTFRLPLSILYSRGGEEGNKMAARRRGGEKGKGRRQFCHSVMGLWE